MRLLLAPTRSGSTASRLESQSTIVRSSSLAARPNSARRHRARTATALSSRYTHAHSCPVPRLDAAPRVCARLKHPPPPTHLFFRKINWNRVKTGLFECTNLSWFYNPARLLLQPMLFIWEKKFFVLHRGRSQHGEGDRRLHQKTPRWPACNGTVILHPRRHSAVRARLVVTAEERYPLCGTFEQFP